MRIEGRSGNIAEVDEDGFVLTRALQEDPFMRASRLGKAWTFEAPTVDIDATDTILFIKNTADDPLFLHSILFNGSNVICEYDLGLGKATTTPAGTTVVPQNTNTEFTKDSETIAITDETAVATSTTMMRFWTVIAGTGAQPPEYPLDGLIIGKNHYVDIIQVTESTGGSVLIKAYRE
tara:strand:- start:14887 stop:15420 length:534 start_codon:yes stop_codon:yes gene_type:complete